MQEQRLVACDARNSPGRNEAGRQQIRVGGAIFLAQMLELGATAGTEPIPAPSGRKVSTRQRLIARYARRQLLSHLVLFTFEYIERKSSRHALS